MVLVKNGPTPPLGKLYVWLALLLAVAAVTTWMAWRVLHGEQHVAMFAVMIACAIALPAIYVRIMREIKKIKGLR